MPGTMFSRFWDIVIFIFLLYTATYDPYDTCFNLVDPKPGSFIYNLDLIVDCVFGIDIVVNFLTPLELPNGAIDISYKNIAINYISGMFAIDFFSCLPTNLVFESSGYGSKNSHN
jgi:hypothetical protein